MQHGVNGGNGTSNGSALRNGDSHVQEVVKAAHEELRQLMRQRAEIMKRIGTLKQTIAGLANLFGDDILGFAPSLNYTEADVDVLISRLCDAIAHATSNAA